MRRDCLDARDRANDVGDHEYLVDAASRQFFTGPFRHVTEPSEEEGVK